MTDVTVNTTPTPVGENKFGIGTIVAVGVLAFVLLKPVLMGEGGFHLGNLFPSSSAEEFPDVPTGKVATAVGPVKSILAKADADDKLALSRLWREDAILISADTSVITSTADIRRANSAAGQLMHLDIKGKYPGLGEAVDKAIKDVLGDDTKALDASVRQDAAAVFNGLSWAANN